MAQNLLSLEEAAAMLGISTDELNRLREDRDVFGVRDGNTWKFKREEIERYRDKFSGSTSGMGSGLIDLPISLDDDEESREGDSVLLSNVTLEGPSSSMSSTVIGKAGELDDEDVDIQLGGEASDLELAGDSGLSLIPSDGGSGVDSDLKLVAADDEQEAPKDETTIQYQASGDSDLELAADDDDLTFSGIGLADDEPIEAAPQSSGEDEALSIQGDSDITLGGSALELEDDDFTLSDSTAGGGLIEEEGSPESTINLVEDDDAGDLVLGGSGTGSDIADSGINLAAAADSGLSLEEPFGELGSDQALGAVQELEEVEDDDFLLTPMLEVEGDESDASGSQVIALDAEEPFDENAATLLGEDLAGMESLGAAPAFAAGPQPAVGGPLAAPAPAMAPAAVQPEAKYGVGTILGLTAVTLVLAMTGIMMYEMVVYMWSWENPSPIVGTLSEQLVGLFEQ